MNSKRNTIPALASSIVFIILSVTLQSASLEAREEEKIIHVEVVKPTHEDVARRIILPGSIAPLEKAALFAQVSGYLKWIKVDIGDWVKKNEILAFICVPQLEAEHNQLEAELARNKADYELKHLMFEMKKNLREEDAATLEALEIARYEMEAARSMVDLAQAKIEKVATLLGYREIRAPFDGIVTERFLDTGALVQLSTTTSTSPIVTVMYVDTVRIFIDAPEPDVPFIKVGLPASISIDALPGKTFTGKITRFSSSLNMATRTMRIAIDIPNPDHALFPGMYGNVTLELELHKDAITVPAECLVIENYKKFLYVVEDDIAKKIAVETAIDTGIHVEITQGLKGNEDIILRGKAAVSEGSRVRIYRGT
ncbi:MAG: efflux RND transporter periplasmic adaptor subunit [Nitrospirae bacterium]|nr:efflux RND transporter periplasmic adaptor subunit [Nitrospirota bacterium]